MERVAQLQFSPSISPKAEMTAGGTGKPHVYLTATPVYIAQKVERVAQLQFSSGISPKAEMTAGGDC